MRPVLLFVALAAASALPTVSFAAPPAATTTATPSRAEVARYVEQLLAQNYRSDGPGAAVLIARGDEVLYRGAIGEADVEHHKPLSADAMFRIGSITKQFAAAGLLKLVEAGKVSLQDPLSKYVKDYPNGEHITVLQLLNHTSGVKNMTEIPDRFGADTSRQDMTTAQVIESFKREPVDFAPGAGFHYSNSGYVLIGAVIEAVTGEPWHRYLATTFFAPLGMTHTGYGADPKIAAQQVPGYSFHDEKMERSQEISMTQPHAAGALVSSVDDLLKWNRALHEGRVLKTEIYQQMITPVGAANEGGVHYGFGIGHGTLRGYDQLDHAGGIFGFGAYLSYLPGSDLTVVLLQNDDGKPGQEEPHALGRRLAAMAVGQPYPAQVAVAVTAAALQQAEGVYRLDAETARVLRVVDGKLTAQRTGGERFELIPIAPDEFVYAGRFDRMKLERDAAGAISGMRFFANDEGDGVVAPRTAEPLPVEAAAVELPRAAMDRVVGVYTGNGLTLKVFVDGQALKAEMSGQPTVALTAASATRFTVPQFGASLDFAPADGPAQALTLTQGGQTMQFKRQP